MEYTKKMPILFVGHGSPMNAIEDNDFTNEWIQLGKHIPKPKAILAVSAHWYTSGTRITDSEQPKTIYDMYGFPDELYQLKYCPNGMPQLAHEIQKMLDRPVAIDNSWGCDHGTWSVLCRMYPDPEIPVLQLSVDADVTAEVHFQIGKELAVLRENGVLIFGSGNVVHNLGRVNWNMQGGYDWAEQFDEDVKNSILKGQYKDVVNSSNTNNKMAFPTPEHFYPLLYVLGAASVDDNIKVTVINDQCVLGALSMTSYLFE